MVTRALRLSLPVHVRTLKAEAAGVWDQPEQAKTDSSVHTKWTWENWDFPCGLWSHSKALLIVQRPLLNSQALFCLRQVKPACLIRAESSELPLREEAFLKCQLTQERRRPAPMLRAAGHRADDSCKRGRGKRASMKELMQEQWQYPEGPLDLLFKRIAEMKRK